jgi:hypothetical protein
MWPIWPERSDVIWLCVVRLEPETQEAETLEAPYRKRVYLLTVEAHGTGYLFSGKKSLMSQNSA